MSIELFLYLADVIPNIGKFFGIMSIVLTLAWLIALIPIYAEPFDEAKKLHLLLVIPLVMIITVACLVPSRQTLYMIGGAQVARQVLDSKIGQKVTGVIEKELEKYLSTNEKEN